MDTNNKIFFLVFVASIQVFLLHSFIVGSGVWGDGQYYYSFLRSAVIDKNLDFENELEYFQRPLETTPIGLIGNKYSIGPAIFWLPFFLSAHFFTLLSDAIGLGFKLDGFSLLYQIFTGIGAVFYGILGLFFCFLTVRKYYQYKIALLATFTIFLSTNLFFYIAIDPINSHPISFLLSSIIVYLLVKVKNWKPIKIILVGVTVGLLIMVRNQDIIFLIPLLLLLKKWKQRLLLPFIAFISFFPQLFVWHYLYGVWQNPYLYTGGKFLWPNPKIFSVLFSANNGLLYYSPVIIASLIGFYYLYRKNHYLATSAMVIFILETYLIASWHAWEGGQAYGGRFFISLMPYFILGLAGLISRFMKAYKIIATASIILVMVNFISIIRFLLIKP